MSDRCLCAVVHRPLRNSSNSSVVEKPLVSVDEQAAIPALLSLFLSCFSRFPEITVQPSIHIKSALHNTYDVQAKVGPYQSVEVHGVTVVTLPRHTWSVTLIVTHSMRLPNRRQTLQNFQIPKVTKKFQKNWFGRNFPGMFLVWWAEKFPKVGCFFYFPGFVLRNSGAAFAFSVIMFQRLVSIMDAWKF